MIKVTRKDDNKEMFLNPSIIGIVEPWKDGSIIHTTLPADTGIRGGNYKQILIKENPYMIRHEIEVN